MSRPALRIDAAVFDMDGVLLDSEPLHHRALNDVLAEDGVAGLTAREYRRYLGASDTDLWEDIVLRYRMPHSSAHYRDRFDRLIIDEYRDHATIAPGVRHLLDRLRTCDVPLAVASSSRTTWIEECLATLELRDYFDAVVGVDMVAHGKPDPAVYLLAAELIGTAPAQCLAVEDSPNGVTAAVLAGMLTIEVDTPYTRDGPHGIAHIHLHSLDDFDTSSVAALLPLPRDR